jgi:hypothetical protein
MCNQTVSLVAAELERQGIVTVAIQLLREAAEAVGPPRALFVPFPHGYPLGEPNNPELQKKIIRAALRLMERKDSAPPLLEDFQAGLGGN